MMATIMLRVIPSLLLLLCSRFQSTRSFVVVCPIAASHAGHRQPKSLHQGADDHQQQQQQQQQQQGIGLYRPFLEHAWKKLGPPLLSPVELRSEFHTNYALAKGMPEGTVVKITVGALQGRGGTAVDATSSDTTATTNHIQYARYALLETLLPGLTETTTSGIQVLNLVIFPTGNLPVWGVDLVSLPGDKHLLAMDVQPMSSSTSSSSGNNSRMDAIPNEEEFQVWHAKHVEDTFAWGGDLPEAAAKFFSPFGLWTRLNGPQGVYQIQTQIMDAFEEHLDLYLKLMTSPPGTTASSDDQENRRSHQGEYLEYRLANDPARPMLKSLYGPEWTERLLNEVLFPKGALTQTQHPQE